MLSMRGSTVGIFILLIIKGVWADFAIQPIPQTIAYDKTKAELGLRLFFDPMLSKDGTVACVNCHSPRSGADNKAVSIGIRGQ